MKSTLSILTIAIVAGGLNLGPAAARTVDDPDRGGARPANVEAPIRIAESFVLDPRPSNQLTDKQLRQRIRALQKVPRQRKVNGQPVGALLKSDRAELQRRAKTAGAKEPQKKARPQAPARVDAQDRQRQADERRRAERAAERRKQAKEAEQRKQAKEAERRKQAKEAEARKQAKEAERRKQAKEAEQRKQAKEAERRKQAKEAEARKQAEQAERRKKAEAAERKRRADEKIDYATVGDQRPPRQLTDAQLRRRIKNLAELTKKAPPKQVSVLRDRIRADRVELNRRITVATGVDAEKADANREAKRLLGDSQPSARLSDSQLRDRMKTTRLALALLGLDQGFEAQLRRVLASDRDELRSRVKRVRLKNRRQVDVSRMNREELRRQMIVAREERRRRLADPTYRIVIPRESYTVLPPRPTILMAEAYDQDIQHQLMAPPAAPIERRYTIDEYRADPSLRTLMPGIEVDTVRFGFNEDFLREEEIYKLERIAEVIERIVAGNPEEVFLIEGHTDLVGSDAFNDALSVRRAAAVRWALQAYYNIADANLQIIGYGEQFPRIPTEFEEPENRRVTVRRITPVLTGSM